MGNQDYAKRVYTVEPYNEQWPKQFQSEKQIVEPIFGDKARQIEHIGSTAVPGLAGKPTIDILVVVDSDQIASVDEGSDQLAKHGYTALGTYVQPQSRLFVKEKAGARLVNLHVFPTDNPHVTEMLTLRDYFRNHPEIVAEYTKLKMDLYQKYPNNYGQYRKYKDEWMEEIKKKITI